MKMIIWLNGAFGAGKTQTAHELKRRIPGSVIYDPEQIGFFINRNIPREMNKGDFQNHPIWRELNFTTLKYIDSEYKGTILVPMTIVNPQYFEEIVGKLRADGLTVNHFVLWSTKETLQKRLRSRGEKQNSWAEQQIDRCMQGLSHAIFDNRIETDELTIERVAETIAAKLNIDLHDDSRSEFKKKLDRMMMRIKRV